MATLKIDEPMEGSYLELAAKYGIDINKPQELHRLVRCMRLAQARFKQNRLTLITGPVTDELGIGPDDEQLILGDPFYKKASAIVAEVMMRDLVKADLRSELFELYRDRTMHWFKNMNQIASGEADKDGERPLRRDQIEAFKALRNDPMARMFDTALMMDPDSEDSAEMQHLQKQKQLLEGGAVKVLKVDGEVVN